MPHLVSASLSTMDIIAHSFIGPYPRAIALREPQAIGAIFHNLYPYELSKVAGVAVRMGHVKREPDVVIEDAPLYRLEIKSSSSRRGVFGNRSDTQPRATALKEKGAYYLVLNYDKGASAARRSPENLRIRFGFLTPNDWVA